ncbi:MAG TPA: GSU2403 family nucleotidyltransferase fold protein [Hyphomonadaceae bacterium]|nr:GSU2403 family nucleotidyltransferase fold protein [Hyphomonadaceae bacterium]
MSHLKPFTDEQTRALVNLQQRYEVWADAGRSLAALPYDLRRKTVGEYGYLYEIHDRSGNGTPLGPWTEETEARLNEYRRTKAELKERRDKSRRALDETCALCRALRVPMVASAAGPILREADQRRLLGSHLLVVGTNAIPAYAVEAGGFILDAPDETEDFDLAWSAMETTQEQTILRMLKAVDSTFTMNTERTFQMRNADAYEVEVLIAPSRASTFGRTDQPRPTPLPEQEWLLRGQSVDRVVICRDGSPARIAAPDPRWFALQKLWLSQQPKRNPLKRPKDFKQGMALLNVVSIAMPQFPLDHVFESSLPHELLEPYRGWEKQRPHKSGQAW